MTRSDQRRHADFIAWAHFQFAVARARQAKALQKDGIQTLILVDADILIGLGDPKHQVEMFRDLLANDMPAHVPGALTAFITDWHASNFSRDIREFPQWGVADDHYSEVVHKAGEYVEAYESELGDDTDPSGSSIDASTLNRLQDVLRDLKKDPWCDVDDDLVHLLSMLGVTSDTPTPWDRICNLRDVLQSLGDNRRVPNEPKPAGLLARIDWSRIDSPDGDRFYRAWREHLRNARLELMGDRPENSHALRRASRSIENDARVLTMLTLVNQTWRETGIRVELLTGSRYLMRAAAMRALNPTIRAHELIPGVMEPMSEFILEPSIIVADPMLWQPLTGERESKVETIPEWSMDTTGGKEKLSERALYFQVIHGGGDPITAPWIDAAPEFRDMLVAQRTGKSDVSFRGFFTMKLSKSMALEQVHAKLHARRDQQVDDAIHAVGARTAVDQLQAHLQLLTKVRRAQIRIDMLEYLIQAHHANRTDGSSTASDVNPFRRPPFVNYSDYEDAHRLYELLSSLDAGTKPTRAQEELISDLKRRVFHRDSTTYILVLVYAHVYAHQARWRLACSAADYAFLLTHTQEYKERGPAILGDESRLLKLACMRRGASGLEEVDQALTLLNQFAIDIHRFTPKEPLIAMRLEIERTSMLVTKLFMEFHADAGPREEKDFRMRAGEALKIIAALRSELDELQREPQQSALDNAVWRDMLLRLAGNGCNAALLAVGWLPSTLKNAHQLQSRRHQLDARYDLEVTAFIDDSMNFLADHFSPCVRNWKQDPHQNLLTLISARLLLSPKLEQWHDAEFRQQLREVLTSWVALPCEHPYDAGRIEYAEKLAYCIRP